jgi:hypothetical protein
MPGLQFLLRGDIFLEQGEDLRGDGAAPGPRAVAESLVEVIRNIFDV